MRNLANILSLHYLRFTEKLPTNLFYTKMITRIAKVVVSLFLSIFLIFTTIISQLEENGIAYDSLKISTAFEVEVRGLSIEITGFNLNVERLKLDLSFSGLISGKFQGEKCRVKGAKVELYPTYEELEDSEPFRYSDLPYLAFNDLRLEDVNIVIRSEVDTILLDFPKVHSSNFVFNDSITADGFEYENGLILLPIAENTSEETSSDAQITKFEIPDYIPKFKFENFVIDSLTFITEGKDFNHKISAFCFKIDGWSNTDGANINLNAFQFDYQDSVHAEFDTSAMQFTADKSLLINDLNFDLPGLAFRLNTFSIDKQDDDYAYVLQLNETRIAPNLIKSFVPDNQLILATAPNIVLSMDLRYKKDTLWINEISTELGIESGFRITGFVSDVWNQQEMQVKLSQATIASTDIGETIDYEISPAFTKSKANLNLTFEGNKDQIKMVGFCNFDDIHTELAAELNDIYTDSLTGNFSIQSPFVSSATFVPDAEDDFKAHRLSIRTEINASNNGSIEKMIFHLKTDSLIHQEYRMRDFELDGNYFKGLTTIFLGDSGQNWRVQLRTRDNVLESKEIRFRGNTVLKTIDVGTTKLINGLLTSDLEGKFKMTEDAINVYCNLDKLKYTSEGNKNSYENWMKLNYNYLKGNHDVTILDKASIDLTAEFNDDLFIWLASEDLVTLEIPDFNVQGRSEIDSVLVHELFGITASADIQSINIQGKNNRIKGELKIPYLAYNSNEAEQLNVDIEISETKKNVLVSSDSVLTSGVHFGQVSTNIDISNDYRSFGINLDAFAQELESHIQLNTTLSLDDIALNLLFNPSQKQHFGASNWTSKTWKPLQFRLEDNAILGDIEFFSKEQSIRVNLTEDFVHLYITELDIGAVIEKAISDRANVESILNFNVNYNYNDSTLIGKGAVNEIVFDSISIGRLNLSLDANGSSQKANFAYNYLEGNLNIDILDYYSQPTFNASINDLDLAHLANDFHLVPDDYDLKGKLNGNVSGMLAEDPQLNGSLLFDETSFLEKEHGASVAINGQKIDIDKNVLTFNKFTLTDVDRNSLFINGNIDILNPMLLQLEANTDRFLILNNLAEKSDVKGILGVKSKLRLKGEDDAFKISGYVNTLDGNRIEYLYAENVELNDMSNTVAFIPFDASELAEEPVEEAESILSILYDVEVNIGTTELYVLLSKSKSENFQLVCTGALNLTNGATDIPKIVGSIESTEGSIYYETPVVSKVEMEIREASATWSGDLYNPEISFLGEETFWSTPNEISSELSNNSKRVPVIVELAIKNKSLDNFDIEFDIRSEDQSVQSVLAPLTDETRSTYAMNMIVYGRVNANGNEDPYLGYQQIVDKLNEISRRNFNETELSFHIAKDSKEVTTLEDLYNSLGYNFSKKLLNDKLKVTIGGSLDLNNSEGSNSELLEKIKVEYNLLKKPDLNFQLSRDNSYKGPIEGQVDQSSVGVSVNFEFDNIFRRKKRKKERKEVKETQEIKKRQKIK